MKTKLTAVSLLAAASLLLGGCSQSEAANRFESYDFSAKSETVVYNENPDLSDKKDTGISSQGDYIEMDFEDYVRLGDCVVVARALDDGKEVRFDEIAGHFLGDGEATAKYDFDYSPVTVTLTEFEVERVISGELATDTVTLVQIGKPRVNNLQVKAEKGKEYLIVLEYLTENVYKSSALEATMFEINADFSVCSLSSDIQSARYDGLPLADLVYDVETAFNTPTNRFESYDFSAKSETVVYNENPDLSGKVIRGAATASRAETDDLSDLVELCGCAAVITATDGGTKAFFDESTGEITEATSSTSALDITLTSAEVRYAVAGEKPGEAITILQLGAPDNDLVQTKLKEGKDYLVLLTKVYDGVYKLTASERTMFEINGDFTVTSVSGEPYCARYDGLPLADLVYDVETAFKK